MREDLKKVKTHLTIRMKSSSYHDCLKNTGLADRLFHHVWSPPLVVPSGKVKTFMWLSDGKLLRYAVPANPTNAQRRESGNVLVLTNGRAEIRQPGRGRSQSLLCKGSVYREKGIICFHFLFPLQL